jgi:hypothetical protein
LGTFEKVLVQKNLLMMTGFTAPGQTAVFFSVFTDKINVSFVCLLSSTMRPGKFRSLVSDIFIIFIF